MHPDSIRLYELRGWRFDPSPELNTATQGYTGGSSGWCLNPGGELQSPYYLPDLTTDLNAMAKVEEEIVKELGDNYSSHDSIHFGGSKWVAHWTLSDNTLVWGCATTRCHAKCFVAIKVLEWKQQKED